MVKRLAIIPARSGSTRIKDKNIAVGGGTPLRTLAVRHAMEGGLFDRIYVSTDSPQYADLARSEGAWIPFLRDSLADEFSGVAQVVAHEVGRIESFLEDSVDVVATLQPTSPFCTGETIRSVNAAFERENAEVMTACFPYAAGNPWWAFRLTDTMEAEFLRGSPEAARSQDLPAVYCPTGAVWFAKVDALKRRPSAYGPGRKFCPVTWKEGLDIDSPDDLEIARALAGASHA